eukprot:1152706-Pelagomonas_calceolata.AAC.3
MPDAHCARFQTILLRSAHVAASQQVLLSPPCHTKHKRKHSSSLGDAQGYPIHLHADLVGYHVGAVIGVSPHAAHQGFGALLILSDFSADLGKLAVVVFWVHRLLRWLCVFIHMALIDDLLMPERKGAQLCW